MQGGRGKRPCKFMENCREWKQGRCNFLHDNDQNMNTGGFQKNPQGGFGGRGGGGRGDYNPHGSGPYNQGGGGYNSQNNYHGQMGQNNRYPNYKNNQQNQQQSMQNNYQNNKQNYNNPQDSITQQFCKFYQIGECKNDQQCKRAHGFTKGDLVRRVLKVRQIPTHQKSRLCTLDIGGAKYFILKQENVITILQYNAQSGQFNQISDPFPFENSDVHWFSASQKYIYYACENKATSFTNIGFIDIQTKMKISIDNAHKLKVTGMLHINDLNNQPLVLSCSQDGTIKGWRISGVQLVLDAQFTQAFHTYYKSNTNFEILFLTKQNLSGQQVLTAGTSDNRLLVWIGTQLNQFRQKIFQQNYNKVYLAKYIYTNNVWFAIAIIWDNQNTQSTLMAVNMGDMQESVLAYQQVGKNMQQLYTHIETIGDLLFLSSMSGFVSIYKIPEFKEKIGCIMHNNGIADMISYKSVTSTQIEIANLFILQKLVQDRHGSLSVYILK